MTYVPWYNQEPFNLGGRGFLVFQEEKLHELVNRRTFQPSAMQHGIYGYSSDGYVILVKQQFYAFHLQFYNQDFYFVNGCA